MFLLAKPNQREIAAFLLDARASELTYPEVGATDSDGPNGYTVDHNRIELGSDWEAAKQAIREWKMFDFGWVELCWPSTPIGAGETFAVVIRHFGFYSLNATRIVYTIDEPDRFGFAYGTLEDHGESGEERFLVEHNA